MSRPTYASLVSLLRAASLDLRVLAKRSPSSVVYTLKGIAHTLDVAVDDSLGLEGSGPSYVGHAEALLFADKTKCQLRIGSRGYASGIRVVPILPGTDVSAVLKKYSKHESCYLVSDELDPLLLGAPGPRGFVPAKATSAREWLAAHGVP